MGLWSSTFGDGNSFTESVANVFTPGDGATYSGGNLVTDASAGTDKEVAVAAGTVINGNKITGTANTTSNDGTVNQSTGVVTARPKGKAPDALGAKDALGAVLNPFSAIPKVLNGIASWANGIDPTVDGSATGADGRMYYTKKGDPNFKYSYNSLGMSYQVEVGEDGNVIDFLSITIDDNGKRKGEEGFNSSTAMTGYERSQAKLTSDGDNDGANQVAQYQANNAATGDSDATAAASSDDIIAMAEAAGLIKLQADMDAILADPTKFLKDRGPSVADLVPKVDGEAAGTSVTNNNDLGTNEGYDATTTTETAQVDNVVQSDVVGYDVEKVNLTANEQVNAATGTVSDAATINAEDYTIDMTGSATGVNADGTKNELGIALNDWASVDISKVIDTSTAAGKLLADKLNKEGKDFVDAKTSILFQMETIAAEFKGPNNEPVIPPWAAALERNVSKSIAFSGISGTAATAALANAIMESTLGVAEKEATFFQTLTTTNLSNKQESIINKASVLAKLDISNLDARSQAAVQNSKNFMDMDLANLTNEQQAEVINKEAMIQQMFDNTAAVNSERLFTATTENELNKFFAELQVTVDRHNTSETNALKKFNAGEINDASQFNADIKNDRQKFLSEMQYNIDVSNAKWRRTVETTNTASMVEAHTADVKAALDLTQEAQNNLWDSADNLLDYIWKTTDNEMERELRLLTAQLTAQSGQSSGGGFLSGLLELGGAYLGSTSGSKWLSTILSRS